MRLKTEGRLITPSTMALFTIFGLVGSYYLWSCKTATDRHPEPIMGIAYSSGNTILKKGLVTAISPNRGISSAHIFRDSTHSEIDIEGETRKIISIEPIRESKDNSSLGLLYKDIVYVQWEPPIQTSPTENYAKESLRHPEIDEPVWIPRLEEDNICWEKRSINGKEDFAVWTGLPKRLYCIVLLLNNRPINSGKELKLGDSGGGWITQSGEILAVTSRIADGKHSPNSQTVYGTMVCSLPASKDNGASGHPAAIPLAGSVIALFAIKILAYRKKIS